MSTASARHQLLTGAVITATGAGMAFPLWLYLDGYGAGAVIGAASGVLALFAAAPAAIAMGTGDLGDASPRATPAEWTQPFLTGGTKTEHKLSRTFRERHLILPNRASAATRKLAAALDARSPARSLASRALGILTAGWGALREIELPKRSRKHGRHAATPGCTWAVPPLLAGEPGTGLLPLPEGGGGEHSDGEPAPLFTDDTAWFTYRELAEQA